MSSAPPRLDAHQHFWKYDRAQYPWIPRASPLHRDWLPPDLEALQRPLGLHGSVAVQARQTLEESRWLLSLAAEFPSIHGVVGWVDLRADYVERSLAELAADPKFVGVRHVVQDEPDPRFLVGQEFMRGISKLRQFGLKYDLLIFPKQLPAAIELVQRFPEQPFVLDHIAKPSIKDRAQSPWQEQIRELAKSQNVWCKLSGMVTEADHAAWQPADLAPYMQTVLEAFGPERLMFGSDWPVCLLAASYERVVKVVADFTASLSEEARAGLFGGNCARFYARSAGAS